MQIGAEERAGDDGVLGREGTRVEHTRVLRVAALRTRGGGLDASGRRRGDRRGGGSARAVEVGVQPPKRRGFRRRSRRRRGGGRERRAGRGHPRRLGQDRRASTRRCGASRCAADSAQLPDGHAPRRAAGQKQLLEVTQAATLEGGLARPIPTLPGVIVEPARPKASRSSHSQSDSAIVRQRSLAVTYSWTRRLANSSTSVCVSSRPRGRRPKSRRRSRRPHAGDRNGWSTQRSSKSEIERGHCHEESFDMERASCGSALAAAMRSRSRSGAEPPDSRTCKAVGSVSRPQPAAAGGGTPWWAAPCLGRARAPW